mmetsp:Transcript_23567/g.66073  ORF Transcript_23567/g.66073 Transcript_23567/m.66073 type:complete len:208 (+) Transcript_23567:1328-1951(+)
MLHLAHRFSSSSSLGITRAAGYFSQKSATSCTDSALCLGETSSSLCFLGLSCGRGPSSSLSCRPSEDDTNVLTSVAISVISCVAASITSPTRNATLSRALWTAGVAIWSVNVLMAPQSDELPGSRGWHVSHRYQLHWRQSITCSPDTIPLPQPSHRPLLAVHCIKVWPAGQCVTLIDVADPYALSDPNPWMRFLSSGISQARCLRVC